MKVPTDWFQWNTVIMNEIAYKTDRLSDRSEETEKVNEGLVRYLTVWLIHSLRHGKVTFGFMEMKNTDIENTKRIAYSVLRNALRESTEQLRALNSIRWRVSTSAKFRKSLRELPFL